MDFLPCPPLLLWDSIGGPKAVKFMDVGVREVQIGIQSSKQVTSGKLSL